MLACATRGLCFVALLSPQATREASCKVTVSPRAGIPAGGWAKEQAVPVRERRCIFAAACLAALAAFDVVPTMVAVCFPADDGAEEEDMGSSCTSGPVKWFMKG